MRTLTYVYVYTGFDVNQSCFRLATQHCESPRSVIVVPGAVTGCAAHGAQVVQQCAYAASSSAPPETHVVILDAGCSLPQVFEKLDGRGISNRGCRLCSIAYRVPGTSQQQILVADDAREVAHEVLS